MTDTWKAFRDSGLDSKDYFEQMARQKLEVGDLFTHPVAVIPVKTQGRSYGSLSQEAVRRGAVIPALSLTQAKKVGPYIFVALWNDNNNYTPQLMAECGYNAILCAQREGVDVLAFPLFGGKEGRKWLWATERGISEGLDTLDDAGFNLPHHVYVTDKETA